MSRCEHGRAEQGSAGAFPLTQSFLESLKTFLQKGFQENLTAN